jgi:hypothetical protein
MDAATKRIEDGGWKMEDGGWRMEKPNRKQPAQAEKRP